MSIQWDEFEPLGYGDMEPGLPSRLHSDPSESMARVVMVFGTYETNTTTGTKNGAGPNACRCNITGGTTIGGWSIPNP